MDIAEITEPGKKERVEIETSVGKLIPVYNFEPDGRKKEAEACYYSSGELRSVPLDEATLIPTPIGEVSCELVTFYRSGRLKRIFPLNGCISGYWTEADEYGLAETVDINTPAGVIRVKPIYLQFYETGSLQSICFWPGETIDLDTPVGLINIRKGIAFHENGNIACCEPSGDTLIKTPVGDIFAYEPDAAGMTAENASLSFDAGGKLSSLSTVKNSLVLDESEPGEKVYSPGIVTSYCDESSFSVVPLKIKFQDDKIICIGEEGTCTIPGEFNRITIRPFETDKILSEAICSI